MNELLDYDKYQKLEIGDRVGFYYADPRNERPIYSGIGVVVNPCNQNGEIVVQILHFLTTPPLNVSLGQNVVVAGKHLFACTDKMGAMINPVGSNLQINQDLFWHKPAWPGEAQAWARVIGFTPNGMVTVKVTRVLKSMWWGNPTVGSTANVPKSQLRLPVE